MFILFSRFLLADIFLCNGFRHFKTTRMHQQGKFILLHVWRFHDSCTAPNNYFPLKIAYFHYFDCKIRGQDKFWVPHICCEPCYNGLTAWFNGKKAALNFAVPMVWRQPWNHADEGYIFLTNITGFYASSRKKIKYTNLSSAMRPVPHSNDLPAPTPPANKDLLPLTDEEMSSGEDFAKSISSEDTVYRQNMVRHFEGIQTFFSPEMPLSTYWRGKHDISMQSHSWFLSFLTVEEQDTF